MPLTGKRKRDEKKIIGNSLWSAGRIQKFKKEIKKFLTEIHDESIISTY